MVGLDGKLYFANLLKSDSRDDYICNAQYPEAMTILPATSVTLTVRPSELTYKMLLPVHFANEGTLNPGGRLPINKVSL